MKARQKCPILWQKSLTWKFVVFYFYFKDVPVHPTPKNKCINKTTITFWGLAVWPQTPLQRSKGAHRLKLYSACHFHLGGA